MKFKPLSKEERRKRRNQLNKKNFPSEVWFEKKLKARGLNRYLRNKDLIGIYFGDFVWRKAKLVVEIDGSSHNGKEEYDRQRDERLGKHGYRVLRIKHGDTNRAEEVLEIISKLENTKKVKKSVGPSGGVTVVKRKSRRRKKNKEAKAFFKQASDEGLAKKWLEERCVEITDKFMTDAQTEKGGYTEAQFNVFGYSICNNPLYTAPPKGWKKSKIGEKITGKQAAEFIKGREITRS